MVDDFRRPLPEESTEEENKQQEGTPTEKPALEAPHLYTGQDGFVHAKASLKFKQKRWWPRLKLKEASHRHKLAGGALAAVLLVGGGTGVYALNKTFGDPNHYKPAAVAQKPEPKPTTEPSRLTGVQVKPELNKRRVTGIMIENSPDARPQSGLNEAGIVYEAIAEGGITRFLALYQEDQPDYIGPVRSARPYYVEYLLPYDASYVHAGGSAQGLAMVRDYKVKDLDHGVNAGAFQRISSRYAPHNLYTSMAALDQAAASRGHNGSKFEGFARKEEKPSKKPTAANVGLTISSALYNVHYDYHAKSNSYNRVMGGQPHTDQRSGKQISPKVVIALVVPYSKAGIYSVYQTTGSGQAYIFQDGVAQAAIWRKAGPRKPLQFTDQAGKAVKLNPGQTWITLVKTPGEIAHSP